MTEISNQQLKLAVIYTNCLLLAFVSTAVERLRVPTLRRSVVLSTEKSGTISGAFNDQDMTSFYPTPQRRCLCFHKKVIRRSATPSVDHPPSVLITDWQWLNRDPSWSSLSHRLTLRASISTSPPPRSTVVSRVASLTSFQPTPIVKDRRRSICWVTLLTNEALWLLEAWGDA